MPAAGAAVPLPGGRPRRRAHRRPARQPRPAYPELPDLRDLLVDAATGRATGGAAVARAASAHWRRHRRPGARSLKPPAGDRSTRFCATRSGISSQPQVSTVAQQGVVFPDHHPEHAADAAPTGQRRNAVRVDWSSTPPTASGCDRHHRRPADHRLQDSVHGATPGRRQGQRHRAGHGPADDRVRSRGRPPFTIDVQVTQDGTTGWVIALAAGSGAGRLDRAADPPGGQGTGPAAPSRPRRRVLTSAPPTMAPAPRRVRPTTMLDPAETTAGIRDV